MGQSTVVATAFTAIMFVAGVSILIMSTVSSFGTLSQAITNQADQTDLVLSERIEFGLWEEVDSSTLHINVTNIGSTSIMLNDFNTVDMILSYNDGSKDQTEWIAFDQSGAAVDYWKINNVYFRNKQQDLINPISLAGNVRGGWDPGETLELEISIDLVASSFDYLTMITPVGIQAHCSFTKEYDLGTTVIPSGTKSILVSHLLDRVPKIVQVTPGSQLNTEFWVEALDSDSFEIHLSNNPTSDVVFYWRIE
jgi:archaellum component FlaF (FlaF/FlaG flagellin family)